MSDTTLSLIGGLNIITEEQNRSLKALWPLRDDPDFINSFLINKEKDMALIFLKLVTSINVESAKNELLTTMSNICRYNETFAKALSTDSHARSFTEQPLVNVSEGHLMCVAYIFFHTDSAAINSTVTSQYLRKVLNTLEAVTRATDLKSAEQEIVVNSVHSLTIFLRRKEFRDQFRISGGLPHLLTMITVFCNDMTTQVQLLYDCLFCLWVSLFHPNGLEILHTRKIIPVVHDVLKRCAKEKCIRMGVFILSTMLELQRRYATGEDASLSCLHAMNNSKGPRFYTDMVGVGLLKTLALLRKRSWGDEDMPSTIQHLEKELQSNVEDLTNFTEYVGEVHSGILEWSPPHTSVKFWKENLKNFENNEFEILRDLGELLVKSKHDVTLAIACHDFGEIVRHHPHGRKILALAPFVNVKEKIIELMSSSSQEVARQALLATQKIMVQRWEFLERN